VASCASLTARQKLRRATLSDVENLTVLMVHGQIGSKKIAQSNVVLVFKNHGAKW